MTASATPTATPQLSARWQKAREFTRIGKYAEAIAEYERILQEEENATAWLRIGELQLAEENYAAAIVSLQNFITAPDAEAYPQAMFMLATAHHSLGQFEQALEYYQLYISQRDVIADYAYEYIGDIQMLLENYDAAVEAYTQVLQSDITGARQVYIREQIARIYRLQEEYEAALAQYQSILDVAKIHFYRSKIEYEIAQTHLEAGDSDKAYERMKILVYDYPESGEAYQSLITLLDAEIAVDEYQRGLVDYYNDAYEPAIRAFYRHINANMETHNGNPHYYAALAYQGLGDYDSAIRELTVLIETHPEDARTSEAWLELGRSWVRLGDYAQAALVYDQFTRANPQDALADDMLWKQAEWNYEQGEYENAAQIYRRLQESYPESDYAARAFFQRGLCHYLLKDYAEAADAFEGLQLRYPRTDFAEKARFWRAKSLMMASEIEEARAVLEEVATAGYWDYYVWRGREMLAEMEGEAASLVMTGAMTVPLTTAQLTAEERAEMAEWLRSWLSNAPDGELHNLSAAIVNNAHYQRGLELWQVGLRKEAQEEFAALREVYRDNPLAIYQLATFFREMGINHHSLVCAERLLDLSPAENMDDENLPAPLREWLFPAFFADLITTEAQQQELDPLLFLALVRQESQFYSTAISSAAAQGLSQVMPSTGEWIAERLGKTDFDTADLYKPYINVKFGVWYLRAALKMFDDNIFSALAGYNAGPGRVAQWREISGDDDDLFLEIIPLTETRIYLRKVYPFYRWYQAIYQSVKRQA